MAARRGTRRDFLKKSAVAAAIGFSSVVRPRRSHAQKRQVVVSSWGGFTEEAIRKGLIPDFEKEYNCEVIMDIGTSAPRFAKLRAQKGNPQVDVILATTEITIRAIKEDLIDKIDLGRLPNSKDLYDWAVKFPGYGPSYGAHATGIGYQAEKVKEPPKKWSDIWDPKYKGRIALPVITYSSAAYLLIRAAELGGGAIDKIEPGYAKLAELKPVVVFTFFTMWAPLAKAGDFDLVVDLGLYIFPQKDKGLPVDFVYPEDGAFGEVNYVNVVKGAKNREMAEAFINGMIGPKYQAANASINYQAPTNKRVEIEPALGKKLVYGENLKRVRFFDEEYIARNRDAWTEKFNTLVLPKWKI